LGNPTRRDRPPPSNSWHQKAHARTGERGHLVRDDRVHGPSHATLLRLALPPVGARPCTHTHTRVVWFCKSVCMLGFGGAPIRVYTIVQSQVLRLSNASLPPSTRHAPHSHLYTFLMCWQASSALNDIGHALCLCEERVCVLRQLLCICNDHATPYVSPHLHEAVQCYHMPARVNHTHSSHTVARTLPIADSPWVAQAARTSSPPRAKGEPSPLPPPPQPVCPVWAATPSLLTVSLVRRRLDDMHHADPPAANTPYTRH